MRDSAASPPALEITGLTKRFGGHAAVRDLSLSLPAGHCFGLIGPNGSGKTTTIKLLMGLLRRDAGSVRVLGTDPAVDGVSVKRRVGYVPERHSIHRWMRVGETVAFCRPFYPRWDDALCGELMERLGLNGAKRVKDLSKGMMVKLSLLLALSHGPELLLLDEPMAGLDALVREELLEGVLRNMFGPDQTILFSSHTLSDVQRLADTIGIIHEGRFLVQCGAEALLQRTKRIRAVLRDGCVPAATPEGVIWQRVRNREWLMTVDGFSAETVARLRATNPLGQVEVIDLSLEDIFKDYVRGHEVAQ